VHHPARDTESIDDVFEALQTFLQDLVGSPQEGAKQTGSAMFLRRLLVTEYIHRFADVDGSFTRSNVIDLTHATSKQ